MRALAELAMRGRAQAILVAAISMLLPPSVWIGAAVVALVLLRRGPQEGLLVMAWVLLAALVQWVWKDDIGPAVILIGTTAAAWVLRTTVSWPYTLLTVALAGVLLAIGLHTVGSDYVERLYAAIELVSIQFKQQVTPEQAALYHLPPEAQLSEFMSILATWAMLVAIIVARWWQAKLYNPGGFREEFHSLRIPPRIAMGLVLAMVVTVFATSAFYLAEPLSVPLLVAGFALVHGWVGLKGWGRAPLVAMYVAWVFLGTLSTLALILAALFDSGWNFRERLRARKQS